jgi:hypothetical protein
VYTVMNLRVPWNAGNFLSSLGHFSFSGRTLLHGVIVIVHIWTTLYLMVRKWILNPQQKTKSEKYKYICCK